MPSGGHRPGAGRPKGASGVAVRESRHAYALSICRQAMRAWEEERRAARENGVPFSTRRPRMRDANDAIAYLTRLKLLCVVNAIRTSDFGTAINGIAQIEDRLIGRVKVSVEHGGPDGGSIPMDGVFTVRSE